MTENETACFENLKTILKNIRSPEALNDHPWTQSLIVQSALASHPHLKLAGPGQQLLNALADLFPEMQPPAPPRHGKRLDPRWGEFGLLAALYFAPFHCGTAFPTSLLDAWGRIDAAILQFVYGKPAEALAEQEAQRYQLVGAELEYGSTSTLSDWHKKGLTRFTEIILNRERFLSQSSAKPSILLSPNGKNHQVVASPLRPLEAKEQTQRIISGRAVWLALAFFLIVSLSLVTFKGWKIYRSGRQLYEDANRLRELRQGQLDLETVSKALPLLKTLQSDLSSFKQEVRPFMWLSPRLGWVPFYGNDLASAPALIDLADHLLNASILSSQAARPILNEFDAHGSSLTPAELTDLLLKAQPPLKEARQELDQALAARGNIDAKRLSPRLQRLMTDELDPVLTMADESLSLALALPNLAGAGSEGPKTYLLLVENEDELRPTGGFITSVGNLVLHNGQVISLEFEEAGDLEDWTKPYPAAPWQLRDYMNSPVLVLRDSNWFPDFPTSALWAEYLYAYTHAHSVDGVIAFDQHLLVMLLGELGPLDVEGVPYPITAQNVIEYMRQAKEPPAEKPQGWYRKEFISQLAIAVLARLTSADQNDWGGLAQVLSQALTERHLLLQSDDPTASAVLAKRGWDNAIHPGEGDFLMVTDTNIGFNKTNAVVQTSFAYDVDLTDPSAPQGTLVVIHKNNARKDVPCIQWNTGEITGEAQYPIDRCYWNYLRIYKQAGVKLLEASPHAIPVDQMILGQPVPAQVDVLEEELDGVQGFGTLLVVPGGEAMSTSFKFALPRTVLSAQDGSGQGELIYHLTVRKQPGTLAIPLVIRIHLPNHAAVKSISREAVTQDNHLLIDADLRTDVEIELVFSRP